MLNHFAFIQSKLILNLIAPECGVVMFSLGPKMVCGRATWE